MEQMKRKYKGFIVRKYIEPNTDNIKEERIFVGNTFAVSKAKAISNIRFRVIGKGRNKQTFESGCDSCITEFYDAELAG